MKTGTIFNIQKFCLHDGDGIRTCVFLKGCPLRCIWCHNPEGLKKNPDLLFEPKKCSLCGKCTRLCDNRRIENGSLYIDREACTACGSCSKACANGANEISGYGISAEKVVEEALRDKIFYDTSGGGITVTGGEPSYQPEFTLEILRLAKMAGISPAMETCGIGSRKFYSEAASLGTTFLYDIKCISSERHKQLTRADNSNILSNLEFLMKKNADIIIRLPMIPGCNDSDEDITLLAEFLSKRKGMYRYAEIMPYHSLGTAKAGRLGTSSEYVHCDATDADKTRWLSLFADYGINVKISE